MTTDSNKIKYIKNIMSSLKIIGELSDSEMSKYFDDLYDKNEDVLKILSNYFNKKIANLPDGKK